MAVTYQEISNVMGPWGASVLKGIDQYLGDNDGQVEDSDLLISSGNTYTDDKARVIQECLDYCKRFREKNFFNGKPEITSGLDQLLKTQTGQLPNAQLFHDTAIACIAAITSVRKDQILKCLRDYIIISENTTYTVDTNKIQMETKEIKAAKKEVVDFEASIYKKMESLNFFSPFHVSKDNTVVGEDVIAYTTQEFLDIRPEAIVNLLMSTDFYYCSAFSDEHVKYFATLQEYPDQGSKQTIDLLSITSFSFLYFFESDFPMTLRQESSYNAETGEYRVKIYALPPRAYAQLLENLGYEATDGKMWTEWRIKSDEKTGSQVALTFSYETKLPDAVTKKMSEFVLESIFNSYREGFDTLKRTQKRIKDVGAWNLPS